MRCRRGRAGEARAHEIPAVGGPRKIGRDNAELRSGVNGVRARIRQHQQDVAAVAGDFHISRHVANQYVAGAVPDDQS